MFKYSAFVSALAVASAAFGTVAFADAPAAAPTPDKPAVAAPAAPAPRNERPPNLAQVSPALISVAVTLTDDQKTKIWQFRISSALILRRFAPAATSSPGWPRQDARAPG